MHVRNPTEPGGEEPTPQAETWTGDEALFRVPLSVIVAKVCLVLVLAGLSLFAPGPTESAIGWIAAAGTAVYALRDLLARERLRVTRDGVTVVRGYARREQVAWSDIERVAVDRRTRVAARSEYLEIDAGTDIFQLSRYDLGADPQIAASALAAIRPD